MDKDLEKLYGNTLTTLLYLYHHPRISSKKRVQLLRETLIFQGLEEPTLEEAMVNCEKKPLKIRHQTLQRCSEESPYKSWCPVCGNGVLLMQREQKDFTLIPQDNCIRCGRRFLYTDLKEAGLV
jgi:hypothetical protein